MFKLRNPIPGEAACLLFMLAVAIFQIVYFRKRRWL
jgi:hypothetical protein